MMIWRASFLIFLSVVYCTTSYADFTLVPGVDLRMEYDDNIYLDPDDEEDDLITTVAPNIAMTWETARLDVTAFASVSMEKYLNNTDEDRVGAGESEQASSLNALARLYRELFFLRVSDTYSRVPVDEGGRGGESNRTVNLTDSNNFQVNPYLQFELMKATQMQLGYTYENQWYGNQSDDENDAGDDAESHIFSASLTREMSARVSASLNGSYKLYRPKSPDKVIVISGGAYEYDEKSASAGLSFMATDRLTLKGSYGHSWLDYDVRSNSDSDTWSASMEYEITSTYTTGVSFNRAYTVSVEDGPSETDRFEAYLQYEDAFTLKGSLFAYTSDYVELDRDDDSYGGVISGELPFNDKVGVTGLFRYTNFDQSGLLGEEYDRYSARCSLYYETRLGRTSVGYIYNRNDSEFSSGDYTNNIIFVSASLRF